MLESEHKIKVTLEQMKCGEPDCKCTEGGALDIEGTIEEVVNAVNEASQERDDLVVKYLLSLERATTSALLALQDRIFLLERRLEPPKGGGMGFHNSGNPTLN